MRKFYHICMSGGNEPICRHEEDYARLFNCIVLAASDTGSSILADVEMSTHVHLGVNTDCPHEMMSRAWLMYSRYFCSRYHRRGRLGEIAPFVLELQGLHHVIAAICYILRNPLHHGVSPTPFAYPFSSANTYFRKELGKIYSEELLSHKSHYRYLPKRSSYPSGYRMTKSGIYLREDVIEVSEVENFFATPRAFLFYMNRLSGEEWRAEQSKDSLDVPPVTIAEIEMGINLQSLDRMLNNENGRLNYRILTDLELCRIIDSHIADQYGKSSVYDLNTGELYDACRHFTRTTHAPIQQVERCIALSYHKRK